MSNQNTNPKIIPRTLPTNLPNIPISNVIYFKKFIPLKTKLLLPQNLITIINQTIKDPSRLKIHYNQHILTLINTTYREVYKLSLNPTGQLLLTNHYKSLSQFTTTSSPQPISIQKDKSTIITRESLMKGNSLQPSPNNLKHLKQIISTLNSHYNSHTIQTNLGSLIDGQIFKISEIKKVNKSFHHLQDYLINILYLIKTNYKSKKVFITSIHGDLSAQNVLLYKDNYSFIDFDRSHHNLAHLDILNFHIYHQTYQTPNPNYQTLFTQLNNLLSSNSLPPQISLLPSNLQNNHINTQIPLLIFIVHMLSYTLTQIDNKDHPPHQLLYNLINKTNQL